jgi:hypothetical protein
VEMLLETFLRYFGWNLVHVKQLKRFANVEEYLYLSMSSKTEKGSHTYSSSLLLVRLSHLLIMSVMDLDPTLRIRHSTISLLHLSEENKKQPVLFMKSGRKLVPMTLITSIE